MKKEKNMIKQKNKRIAISDFLEENSFDILIISMVTVVIVFAICIFLSWIKKCPDCNKLQFTSDRYCTECGHDFYNYKVCDCGTRNNKEAKYCRKCGKELSEN